MKIHVWEVFHYCGLKIVDGIFSSPAEAQLYRFELDNDAEKVGSRRRHEIAHLMVESDLIGIPADAQQAMCSRELPELIFKSTMESPYLESGYKMANSIFPDVPFRPGDRYTQWGPQVSVFLNGDPVQIADKIYEYNELCHDLKVNAGGYDLFLFRDNGPVIQLRGAFKFRVESGMEFGTQTKSGASA